MVRLQEYYVYPISIDLLFEFYLMYYLSFIVCAGRRFYYIFFFLDNVNVLLSSAVHHFVAIDVAKNAAIPTR